MDKDDINELNRRLSSNLGDKVDIIEVQNALNSYREDLTQNFTEFK